MLSAVKESTDTKIRSEFRYQIADLTTRENLSAHKEGEIIVKCPSIMKGYCNNRKATDEVLQNGWFSTGRLN